MKIQVLAEREQKIQTEVKEIRKVFFCELCNKQYRLAIEFEAHLSSYDHNHRKVVVSQVDAFHVDLSYCSCCSSFLIHFLKNWSYFTRIPEVQGNEGNAWK